MADLYPYQRKAVRKIVAEIKAGERPLCYAPTGAGKTRIAAEVFRGRRAGAKVFVVHTDVLRTQAQEVLRPFGVWVTTIQGLLLMPRERLADVGLVCFDEAHHLQGQRWREAVEKFPEGCGMFGLSATPYSGELERLFTCFVKIATVQELVAGRYILPVQIGRPADHVEIGPTERVDGAHAYAANFMGRQAIHFEPTIALSKRAVAEYETLGVSAAVVSGKTPAAERERLIGQFRDCALQVLVSPVLLSEGFDAPNAEVLVAGRAFKSDVLLQQAIGRIRRKFRGKTIGTVLDCTRRCDTLPADYFNTTDESAFGALPVKDTDSASEGGKRTNAGAGAPDDVEWLKLGADGWVFEEITTLHERMSRAAQADEARLFEFERDAGTLTADDIILSGETAWGLTDKFEAQIDFIHRSFDDNWRIIETWCPEYEEQMKWEWVARYIDDTAPRTERGNISGTPWKRARQEAVDRGLKAYVPMTDLEARVYAENVREYHARKRKAGADILASSAYSSQEPTAPGAARDPEP